MKYSQIKAITGVITYSECQDKLLDAYNNGFELIQLKIQWQNEDVVYTDSSLQEKSGVLSPFFVAIFGLPTEEEHVPMPPVLLQSVLNRMTH